MMRKNLRSRLFTAGFTLIELLIVVAIIAILAAIAVPNFLEAQTRSKVSRAKADMRTLRTGLESYMVDNNHYPPDHVGNVDMVTWKRLTTPVAYLASVPTDPFLPPNLDTAKNSNSAGPRDIGFVFGGEYQMLGDTDAAGFRTVTAWGSMSRLGMKYWMLSYGPNLVDDFWKYDSYGDVSGTLAKVDAGVATTVQMQILYDPTNGTVSTGDLIASNKRLYD